MSENEVDEIEKEVREQSRRMVMGERGKCAVNPERYSDRIMTR